MLKVARTWLYVLHRYTVGDVDLSPKELTAFRVDPELMEALRLVKERDGIPIAEQVRRGLQMWFDSKGVKVKTARKRARTGKRAR
jgi:hypothetical protein